MRTPIQITLSRMNLATNATLVAFLISSIMRAWPDYEDELVNAIEALDVDDVELGRIVMAALRRVQGLLDFCVIGPNSRFEFVSSLESEDRLNEFANALATTPFRNAGGDKVKLDVELLCAQLLQAGFNPESVALAQMHPMCAEGMEVSRTAATAMKAN